MRKQSTFDAFLGLLAGMLIISVFVADVFGAISHVQTDGNAAGSATSISVSHSCSGTDIFLAVCVTTEDFSSGSNVSSVNWNSTEALTLLNAVEVTPSTGNRAEVWYLEDPTATTANVDVVISEEVAGVTVHASCFSGVDGTNLQSVTATGDLGSVSPSQVSITTDQDDEMVVDCFNHLFSTASLSTSETGQTEQDEQGSGAHHGAVSTLAGGTAGSKTMGWTATTSREWSSVVYSLEEQAAAGAVSQLILVH